MQIAIIDADLIYRKKHRFPNLASMKISNYHKTQGDNVELLLNYNNLERYDKIYISKVFTDTKISDEILTIKNVVCGGTGFYYDKSPPLPYEIEHCMPDYSLYNQWIKTMLDNGTKQSEFKCYTDYSIGFLTRGCFRQCKFCVNQNYKKVNKASSLSEFYDSSRKKILLLDDNFLGYSEWREELEELNKTGKRFRFKQGLDFRLLNDEKCKILFECKYDGEKIFAFDNYNDKEIIENKLKLSREYTDEIMKFYVFTGFDRNNKWDSDFWIRDLYELFERIKILIKYKCLPYIMRFNKYEESPYKGVYISVARWCNQPSIFKKMSLIEFAQTEMDKYGSMTNMKYLNNLISEIPDMKKYLEIKWK